MRDGICGKWSIKHGREFAGQKRPADDSKGCDIMLDGKSAVPLYVQLMDQIEDGIRQKVYLPGMKLQSENEMAKTYGVSNITVKNAISGLVEKGLVVRKQGKGTFVSKTKFTRDMNKLSGFTEMCERMGVKPGGQMLDNRLVKAEGTVAEQLKLAKNSQVILISRIRFADREPVAVEHSYFPSKYACLLSQRFDDNSLFKYLKERENISVKSSEKRIELCRATEKEAELLGIRKGDPLLYVKSVAFSKDGEPLYAGIQVINGDVFSFYVYETAGG